MDSLRILFCAGAVAAGLAAPAHAADLLPPPPTLEAPGVAVTELGTGWYLRGDIGYVEYTRPKEDKYSTLDLPPLNHLKLANTWSFGGGIGYQFNNWFRMDVTADYRLDSDFGATSSRSGYVEGYSTDRAKLESANVLLNAYLDLGNWGGITPYVGAGVGAAQNRLHAYSGQVTCKTVQCGSGDPLANYSLGNQPMTFIPSKTTYDLAWALMAGVAVDVGAGFKIDAGYRYVNLGEAATGLDRDGVGTKFKAVEAHEIRVGLRYMID